MMILSFLTFVLSLLHFGSAQLDGVDFFSYGPYSSSSFVWATNVPVLQFNITFPTTDFDLQIRIGKNGTNTSLTDLRGGPGWLDQFNVAVSNLTVSFSQQTPPAGQSNIYVLAGTEKKSRNIIVRDCGLPGNLKITGETIYNQVSLVQCRTGTLYVKNARNENLYIRTAKYTCRHNATWDRSNDYAKCYTAPLVDFRTKISDRTFAEGTQVRFFCYHEGSKSQMTLFNETIKDDVIERDIILTSRHHGKKVTCEKADANGTSISERNEATIKILFPPKRQSPASQSRDLRVGDEIIVTLQFEANPALTSRDVSISLNGKPVSNFYVEVSGLTHTIVIHFRSVTAADFGLYLISVKGLTFNYLLKEDTSSRPPAWLTSSAIAAIALAAVLFVVLILMVVLYVRQRKTGTKMDVEAKFSNVPPIVKTQNAPAARSRNPYHTQNTKPAPSRAPPQSRVAHPPPQGVSRPQEVEDEGDTYECMMEGVNPPSQPMQLSSRGPYLESTPRGYQYKNRATQQFDDDAIYDN